MWTGLDVDHCEDTSEAPWYDSEDPSSDRWDEELERDCVNQDRIQPHQEMDALRQERDALALEVECWKEHCEHLAEGVKDCNRLIENLSQERDALAAAMVELQKSDNWEAVCGSKAYWVGPQLCFPDPLKVSLATHDAPLIARAEKAEQDRDTLAIALKYLEPYLPVTDEEEVFHGVDCTCQMCDARRVRELVEEQEDNVRAILTAHDAKVRKPLEERIAELEREVAK